MIHERFATSFARNIFRTKYAQGTDDTWDALAVRLVEDVCGSRWGTDRPLMSTTDREYLEQAIKEFKFIPGGRYLYYAGRPFKAYNNCYLLRAEDDTREEWSALTWRAMSCLMTGGGIGADYSRLRPAGYPLSRTGGTSSGPIPLMHCINEVGRNVMQGGSRRSAIYASLNWKHEDIPEFLTVKNWSPEQKEAKNRDFNASAPLDMTNISVNYDNAWLNMKNREQHPIFLQNVYQAMSTGEPGFSFNFGDKENETLRNAPVAAGTRVLTKDGYRYVGDIVGKTVIVWTGKQWAPTVFKKTKSNVNLTEVFLSNGRSIKCDPEHPFLVFNKHGEPTRTAASELVPGDGLECDLPQDIPKYESDYYGDGFVFGDGSVIDGRGEISVHTESKQICYERAVLELGAHSVGNQNRAYFSAPYKSKNFMGVQSFVAGWFDADGCVSRNILRLSCKDEGALFELREYLDGLGIKSTVRQDGCSGYAPDNNIYTLTVFKESFKRFKELIPTERLKVDVGSTRRQHILVTSVSVDTGWYEDVYCCDVGVDEHSFMAEGVLVSNCTEVTSEDDSDVCNLGSINLGNITNLEEFQSIVHVASKFLVCGTLRADLPYDKVYQVREKNRRLGLGLMGIHEWLLRKGYKYEVVPELHKWLGVYKNESEKAANEHCDHLFISRPVAYRAIAPTGTIGILASTTTGIEPLFAVAYKRRYLSDGTKWKYEFVVDSTADQLIREYDLKPENIDTAYKLSHDYERRIKFQADIQDYVDMSISSTINLPAWGSKGNGEGDITRFSQTLSKYAPRLRGFTCYPDGSRGGQPLTEVEYDEALKHKGVVFEENDICSITGKGGSCGI